jgi:hypothetical protein
MWLMVNQWNYDGILWEYNGIIKHGKLKKFQNLPSFMGKFTISMDHFRYVSLSEGIEVNGNFRASQWVEAPNDGWNMYWECDDFWMGDH